jgi:hypothetical protein
MQDFFSFGWPQVNTLVFLALTYAAACLAPVAKGRPPSFLAPLILVSGIAAVLGFAGFWTAG